MLEAVREGELLPAGKTGRCDAFRGAGLGLPARPRRVPARPGCGHRAACQLRAARRLRCRRVRTARSSASGLAWDLRSSGPAVPRARATCRPGRATRATPPRRGWRCRATPLIATGHTADDQVETILYRLASSPSRRALLGMRPRDGSLVRPLLGLTREQTTAYCEERGLALARRPDQRGDRLRAQPRPPRLAPALARDPPGRGPQRPAHGRAAARRGRGARRPGRRRARRLQRVRPDDDRARRGSPSCRRPCAASSCSGSPTAPPAGRSPAPPATPTRSRPCAAPAPRCSTSAAASAPSPSAASSAPSATPEAGGRYVKVTLTYRPAARI